MGARRRRQRDAEFTDFVDQASPELLRIGWYLTGDVHRAQDLVQSALLRTYAAWHRVDPPRAVAYTRTTMLNLSRDEWRRTGREIPTDDAAPYLPDAPDHAAMVGEQDQLVRGLRLLTPRQRAVVVLRYYCDLSEQQCADELGISVGGVKSTASRGLERLRQHLSTVTEEVSP